MYDHVKLSQNKGKEYKICYSHSSISGINIKKEFRNYKKKIIKFDFIFTNLLEHNLFLT